MTRRRPQDVALLWAFAQPSREQDAVVEEVLDRACRATETVERCEHQANRGLHLRVRV